MFIVFEYLIGGKSFRAEIPIDQFINSMQNSEIYAQSLNLLYW